MNDNVLMLRFYIFMTKQCTSRSTNMEIFRKSRFFVPLPLTLKVDVMSLCPLESPNFEMLELYFLYYATQKHWHFNFKRQARAQGILPKGRKIFYLNGLCE